MEEVPGGPRAGGERARRWRLSKLLWKPEMQEALLPPVGSTVGGYHLEAKLGRGGQSTVYRARAAAGCTPSSSSTCRWPAPGHAPRWRCCPGWSAWGW